jgi:uncharacterized protein (TIGR02466 family)
MNENLEVTEYFQTPIYVVELPEWVASLNKEANVFIEKSKKDSKSFIKQRNKVFGKDLKDFGISYNSSSLINELKFKKFKSYIENRSIEILDHMGYCLKNHGLKWTELWVQEFSKTGGGNHEGHVHQNNHISGFYFLKCSEKTSYPIFYDPRQGKNILQLPIKKETELNIATEMVNYKIKPGTLIIFPSYLPHQFVIDHGIDPFRFIHFNMQAISKDVL